MLGKLVRVKGYPPENVLEVIGQAGDLLTLRDVDAYSGAILKLHVRRVEEVKS